MSLQITIEGLAGPHSTRRDLRGRLPKEGNLVHHAAHYKWLTTELPTYADNSHIVTDVTI